MQEQWNEGLPPAGEVGMMVGTYRDAESERFYFMWRCDSRGSAWRNLPEHAITAFQDAARYSMAEITAWRWATLADPGVTVDMLHPSQRANRPWLPPQQEGYGPWIECAPGDELPHVRGAQVLYADERDSKEYSPHVWSTSLDAIATDFVAYCVKLEAAQGETPPFVKRVKPGVIPSTALVGTKIMSQDWRDLNMILRDEQCAEPKRARPLPPLNRAAIAAMIAEIRREGRDEAVAEQAFVEHGFDHRFGKFV